MELKTRAKVSRIDTDSIGPEKKEQQNQSLNDAESHYKKIFRVIEWPRLPKALKYAAYCIVATTVISITVYLYEFGLHYLISLFT